MIGYEDLFTRRTMEETDNLGTVYDYSSVMHFPSTYYSKNQLNTINAIGSGTGSELGNLEGMSDNDVLKVNTLYQCDYGKYMAHIVHHIEVL